MVEDKEKEFGDFVEVKDENIEEEPEQEGFIRARMPRDKQVVGVILQRFGGNRMEVHSSDGKVRNCRVPGRYRRRLWLRPKDIVLIEPWIDDDEKGDIVYKYPKNQVYQLRKKGILDFSKDDF